MIKHYTCVLKQVNGWLMVGDRFPMVGVGGYRQAREEGYNVPCSNEPELKSLI